MTLSVLLLGLGQIGMGYDFDAAPGTVVLTHARAFYEHPKFVIAGGVDLDPGKRERFSAKYAAPSFPDIESAMNALRPNIVVVATPTASHFETVHAVLGRQRPWAILCEKPLAYKFEEAEAIVSACAAKGCALYVNYIRNSEPGALEVKKRLSDGRIELPVKGVVWYSKGVFNNGSHFLNLLQSWLGKVQDVRVYSRGRLWDDVDPEPDFHVSFSRGEAIFLAAKEENFSHYTVELVAANGRLRYEQAGALITWHEAVSDPICAGYTILGSLGIDIKTNYERSLWHVADQLAVSLEGKSAEICIGEDALLTIKTLHAIMGDL
jgi:predicted dehydrogenase